MAANASVVEPVVIEEPEAEGDDEHTDSTVHSDTNTVLRLATATMPAVVVQPPRAVWCAASVAGSSPFAWTRTRVQAAQGQ